MKFILKTLMIYVAALSMSLAQTTDVSDATESFPGSDRARLADERIQAEAERRAREAQRRLEEAELARLRAEEAEARSAVAAQNSQVGATEPVRSEVAAGASSTTPGASRRDSSVDTSRTLQHLRMLGELKDDGYVTEEEFERIKNKILDARF